MDTAPPSQQKLLLAVQRMPSFPQSVQKLLEITRQPNCEPKQIIAVIEKDPVMTASIMRMVNSALFTLPNKISSVHQATVFLGLNTVKNLALSVAALGVLPRGTRAGVDMTQFFMHLLTVAAIARELADEFDADPGDAYIAGLLHDVGKAVMLHSMSEEFAAAMLLARQEKIPLHEAERRIFGTDHALVGGLLTQHWKLPEKLIAAVRDHHQPMAGGLTGCVQLANLIARRAAAGFSGNAWREEEESTALPQFAAQFADFPAALEKLGEAGTLETLIERARAFAQM